jgi:type IV secretory pathway VirB2 component (pilin)
MAVSKIAVRKTVEFLLYFVTLMVYMGIASLFGYDLYSFESNWAVLVYLLVLNFFASVTVNYVLSRWNKRKKSES